MSEDKEVRPSEKLKFSQDDLSPVERIIARNFGYELDDGKPVEADVDFITSIYYKNPNRVLTPINLFRGRKTIDEVRTARKNANERYGGIMYPNGIPLLDQQDPIYQRLMSYPTYTILHLDPLDDLGRVLSVTIGFTNQHGKVTTVSDSDLLNLHITTKYNQLIQRRSVKGNYVTFYFAPDPSIKAEKTDD